MKTLLERSGLKILVSEEMFDKVIVCPECRGYGDEIIDQYCSPSYSWIQWKDCHHCYGKGFVKKIPSNQPLNMEIGIS